MSDDNVRNLFEVALPDENVQRTQESLDFLNEVGLVAYVGDGTERFHLTNRGWRSLQTMMAMAVLTAWRDPTYTEEEKLYWEFVTARINEIVNKIVNKR